MARLPSIPARPGTLYAGGRYSSSGRVHKSTDGATSWPLPGLSASCARHDARAPNALRGRGRLLPSGRGFCSVGSVLKSTDGGGTWQAASTGLSDEGAVVALAVDPTTPRTLYAGTTPLVPRYNGPCTGGGVFTSTDGGGNWQAVNRVCPTPLPSVRSPSTPSLPVRSMQGQTAACSRATDAGGTGSAVNMGLINAIVSVIAIDPPRPHPLRRDTGAGVFKSTDGGATWQAVNTGRPDQHFRRRARRRSQPRPLRSTPGRTRYLQHLLLVARRRLQEHDGSHHLAGAEHRPAQHQRLGAGHRSDHARQGLRRDGVRRVFA